ncbi:hypothetical protein [Methanotorris formicicus]|uniref:DUF3784 domain-containing protein n=1 Tax=Methanotorris formicicus Mc-S-70 TaxID=647171 RepID=H1L0W5_9EURY|nr:hypothetical protein [Methanotorris formicicus]EHP84325.1 hypothetical protein MetfoDRAFT_1689 [Methanotorris formicicus Mc-S-70]
MDLNDMINIVFIIIYVGIIPWFVNWIILNKNNKTINFLKSFDYIETMVDTKTKIIISVVELVFVIGIILGYNYFHQFLNINKVIYLLFSSIVIFFVDYSLKIHLLSKTIQMQCNSR